MVEDLFAKLSGEGILSKLDIRQAYQQIRFYEASKKLVTNNTQKGCSGTHGSFWGVICPRHIPASDGRGPAGSAKCGGLLG